MEISVNWLAVLVTAVVGMVVGSIWYGPLFGKKYMSAMGMDSWSPEKREEMKKGMMKSYVGQFIASVVMNYVLAWFMIATNHTGVAGGLTTALWVWVGFVVPIKLGEALWGGKMSLFWLGIGGMLVGLLVTGAILGAM